MGALQHVDFRLYESERKVAQEVRLSFGGHGESTLRRILPPLAGEKVARGEAQEVRHLQGRAG